MFRKSKTLICVAAILLVCLCIPFESNAYGQNDAMDFYVKYSEPSTSGYNGYISVAYKTSTSSNLYRMYTYFWTFMPDGDTEYAINNGMYMAVKVDASSISFEPVTTIAGGGQLVLACYDWNDGLHILHQAYLDYLYDSVIVYTDNYSSTPIAGYCYSGNMILKGASTLKDTNVPTIHWNESVDASTLSAQMEYIFSSLNNIDSDTSTMISKLENIYNQNVATNQKLDDMNALLEEIKAEQEESNTWLEKIFNWLKESPEQEKQEATTQGNQSTSDATTAITDNSQGFIDSLGGLASSMSYSGTDCAWTFPAITLPAIPGVMDSMQLTTEKPIDFSYWVNQIPANLLLLIQSLLTIALIIYCFKEVYGTISYVLTLRGGGNNE